MNNSVTKSSSWLYRFKIYKHCIAQVVIGPQITYSLPQFMSPVSSIPPFSEHLFSPQTLFTVVVFGFVVLYIILHAMQSLWCIINAFFMKLYSIFFPHGALYFGSASWDDLTPTLPRFSVFVLDFFWNSIKFQAIQGIIIFSTTRSEDVIAIVITNFYYTKGNRSTETLLS